jgi:hypothetical protein
VTKHNHLATTTIFYNSFNTLQKINSTKPQPRRTWAFYYITLTLPKQGDRLSVAFHSRTICLEGEKPSHAVPTATLFGANTLGV